MKTLLSFSMEEDVKKVNYSPSPYPLPRGAEGKNIEIEKKFPPPGRGRVGVICADCPHLKGTDFIFSGT